MYSVSGALVKAAGKFNNANSGVELNVTSKSEIERIQDDPTISKQSYNLIHIQDIINIE